MQRSQDNFYWSQMLKHLPEQIRGPVPNKKEREQVIRHLRSKRSLEIQRYFNAMRDWIGEREMRTENRRFQWFASIALSCLTTSHLRRQPLSDTEQHVSAHVCKVRLADQLGTTPFSDTSAFPQYRSGETSEKRTSGPEQLGDCLSSDRNQCLRRTRIAATPRSGFLDNGQRVIGKSAEEMPVRRGCALPPGLEDHTVSSEPL